MSLTDEQRQKLGGLLAQQRDLKNQLNKIENQLAEEILAIIGQPLTESKSYDLSKIKTERTEGPSGFYQKATEQDNEDYRNLLKSLKAHDGKLTRNGFWIWLFNDEKSIGMKPSKK